jgi:hypothetical protein
MQLGPKKRACAAGTQRLATAIVFILMFGRNVLSRRLSAEDQGPGQPSAFDLAASYGLADKWRRLQVPVGSPLIEKAGRGWQQHLLR